MASLTGEGYWDSIVKAGLCRIFVLKVLHDTPLHGYGIIQRIASMTDGFCTPTEGGLYPILKEFELCGCATVSSQTVEGRERYGVPPGDPESLASAIVGLLGDPDQGTDSIEQRQVAEGQDHHG